MANRFQSIVEYNDRSGRTKKEVIISCEPGKKPTVGDFVAVFREDGYDVELTDFAAMVFKPRNPAATTLLSLRIIRTMSLD